MDISTYSANRTSVMDVDEINQAEDNGVAGSLSQGIIEEDNQNSDQHGRNDNPTASLDFHTPASQSPQDTMERTDNHTSFENTYQDQLAEANDYFTPSLDLNAPASQSPRDTMQLTDNHTSIVNTFQDQSPEAIGGWHILELQVCQFLLTRGAKMTEN